MSLAGFPSATLVCRARLRQAGVRSLVAAKRRRRSACHVLAPHRGGPGRRFSVGAGPSPPDRDPPARPRPRQAPDVGPSPRSTAGDADGRRRAPRPGEAHAARPAQEEPGRPGRKKKVQRPGTGERLGVFGRTPTPFPRRAPAPGPGRTSEPTPRAPTGG